MASSVVTYLNTMPEHRKRECARLTGTAARHFYEDPQNLAEFDAWLIEYRKTHPEERKNNGSININ